LVVTGLLFAIKLVAWVNEKDRHIFEHFTTLSTRNLVILMKPNLRSRTDLVRLQLLFALLFLPCAQSLADTEELSRNSFGNKTYIQLQTGFASDADFGPSLFFVSDEAVERTYFQGVAFGRRLGSSLFGWKVEIVGFFGLQRFRERNFQADGLGVTAYWKIYRRWTPRFFPSSLPLRFGLGQGLSYTSRIPVAEIRDFEPDESAQTVHYLEWTFQVPVSGLLQPIGLRFPPGNQELWIGYSIFHRSTVFGLFADTGGGINYPGITLEYTF